REWHCAISAFACAFDSGIRSHRLIYRGAGCALFDARIPPMRRYLFCSTLAVLCLIAPAFGGKLRPPTPAEQQVLQKYENVINKTLDQFQSADWDENVDYSVNDDVAVAPDSGRPLDVDEMFQRTYRVRNGSERWNRIIAPAMAKMQD